VLVSHSIRGGIDATPRCGHVTPETILDGPEGPRLASFSRRPALGKMPSEPIMQEPAMNAALAEEFNAEMLSLFDKAGQAMGYWPRYFLKKVKKVGGLKMAQDLLETSGKKFTGLGRLADENKLELSVEYIALKPKWSALFTSDELDVARTRLEGTGYTGTPQDDAENDLIVYFNNCRNRDHVALFERRAFYDLNTTGVQGKQARNLRPGQECVVATTDADKVRFTWYSFIAERLMRERIDNGVWCRVFIGTVLFSESLSKAKAANDPLYAPFFNVNGHFKQLSTIQAPRPASAAHARDEEFGDLMEGAPRQVTSNVYERNTAARKRCIDHHKPICKVCGFDFAIVYGPLAVGFIHVHHLKALSEIGKEYRVDPVKDMCPVCPNCHAVIHLGGKNRRIEDVKELIESAAGRRSRPNERA
jgi:hypothetical protein